MSNTVAMIVILAILGLAIYYIISQKRKGIKCGSCGSKCCSTKEKEKCSSSE